MKLTILQKLPFYQKLMWALFVLFSVVGYVAGHHLHAVVVVLIITVTWVVCRIIGEAWTAWLVLKSIGKLEKETFETQHPDEPSDKDAK